MKRLFNSIAALAFVFLSSSIGVASADYPVLSIPALEQTELTRIHFPADTPIGNHYVLIKVLDPDNSIANTKTVFFCIDINHVLQWSNICDAVLQEAPATPVVPEIPIIAIIAVPPEALVLPQLLFPLPTFSPEPAPVETPIVVAPVVITTPKDDTPEKTRTIVGLLALMTISGAATQIKFTADRSIALEQRQSDALSQGAILSVQAAELAAVTNGAKWGDKRSNWKNRFTTKINSLLGLSASKISSASPLAARTMLDAQYLRTIIGTFAWLTVPLGATLAIFSTRDNGNLPVPPSLLLLSGLILLGVMDAFAGFIAATILFLASLTTGNINNKGELLTMLAISALCFAPGLIASSIRPLRRLISDIDTTWERISDYLIAGALTGYTISKMVAGLNGLGGEHFAITKNPTPLILVGVGAVTLRLIFEDLALYLYPSRLAANAVSYAPPTRIQQSLSLILKVAVFVFIAERFIGYSFQLWLGSAIVFLPSVLKILLGQRIHGKKSIGRWLPLGPLQLVLIIVINGILAKIILTYIPDTHEYIVWGFVFFVIPTLIVGLISLFADPEDSEEWRKRSAMRWVYRLGGVLVFIGLMMILVGVDISGNIYDFFNNLMG